MLVRIPVLSTDDPDPFREYIRSFEGEPEQKEQTKYLDSSNVFSKLIAELQSMSSIVTT